MVVDSGAQQAVRKLVLDRFVENGSPPVVEEVMTKFGLSRIDTEECFHRLEDAHELKLVPGTSRILMAFPFSAIATPFRVTTGARRSYFANCAWDAVAIHLVVDQPIRIDAFCHDCGRALGLDVRDGKAAGDLANGAVVYLGLPAAEWWTDIIRTCSNTMVFFASPGHYEEWRRSNPEQRGRIVSIDQIIQMSEPIYKGKLELGYARPSKSEMNRHLQSLGFVEAFWRL